MACGMATTREKRQKEPLPTTRGQGAVASGDARCRWRWGRDSGSGRRGSQPAGVALTKTDANPMKCFALGPEEMGLFPGRRRGRSSLAPGKGAPTL